MARMHSRAKGKSKSRRPVIRSAPNWLKIQPKEIEMLILKYAKEGKSPSQIGILLRDEYGVPDIKAVIKKSVTEVLKEKGVLPNIPEDLMSLMKKAVKIRKHLEENKHDETARIGLHLTESRIFRLVKYYKKSKRLSEDWKYDPESMKLLVE